MSADRTSDDADDMPAAERDALSTGAAADSAYWDERLADPAVFLEIAGIARHRQAQQPDAVGKATKVRLILGDGTAVEFRRERQCSAHIGRRCPSRVEWQVRAEFIDLGDKPLLDMTGFVAD